MRSRSAKFRWLLGAAVLLAIAALAAAWVWPRRQLPSRGGIYFPWKLKLAVRPFRQADPRWGGDPLANTKGTLAAEGCAVTSTAMVLASYGVDTDPGRLNRFLTRNGGYVGNGWLVWEKAAEFPPGRCQKAYEDNASFARIDLNLLRGNPVIVRVRLADGGTHFVVIAGKAGWDYLIRDPASRASRGMYPLCELAPAVEALRYYRRLP